ncbi:hypothetical protein M427DRAFT_289178 [Gonapodya prolifera JEL478]|uniref:Major facilitator superfamily (MFS) profile domain-containing protein n=1 Tax=Gonapodya prolifera (strain JEL478) TaxID=1344416 RepID=A0A139AIY2_GONPJ|nr:hypothetical protein M427DRAFT_289178 [Gonapodya prolifera JEL478]|eukprot:KXS16688.1 hypothetical protein M427DRAFT_289178 [Gonapodya prolifera JEL478]
MAMSLLGIALVWAFTNSPVNALGLLLAGLGQGPLYPTAITIVPSEISKKKSNHLMAASLALVVAGGNVGDAFVPWIVGLARTVGWCVGNCAHMPGVDVSMAVCWVGMR